MNNNMMQIQRETKYKSARTSLLLVLVFSAINVFSIALADTYFLFSSYFSFTLSAIGSTLYAETGSMVLFVVFALLALVSLVPYLLCYIFSKNRPGWMIAALVLFSVDTLLLLLDFAARLLIGDLSVIIDVLFHIYAIVCLAIAVKHGLAAKKTPAPEAAPTAPLITANGEVAAADAVVADEATLVARTIVIQRKKGYVGCAVALRCYLDGVQVGELKNGAKLELTTSGAAHELMLMTPAGDAATATVSAGDEGHCYTVSMKMGMTATKLILEETTSTAL